jgi:hypothetical protein
VDDSLQTIVEGLQKVSESDNSGSDSSKYIINNEKSAAEQPLYLKNISKSLDLIVKLLVEKEQVTQPVDGAVSEEKQSAPGEVNNVNERSTTKLSSILTETEKQRYKSIFEVLGNTLEIGKFAKGPEANRLLTPSIDNREDIKQILPQTSRNVKEDKPNSLLATLAALALAYDALSGNISGAIQSIFRAVKQSFNALIDDIMRVTGKVKKIFTTLVDDIGGMFKGIKGIIKPYIDEIVKFLGNLLPGWAKNLLPAALRPGNVPTRPPTPSTPPGPARVPTTPPTVPGPVNASPAPASSPANTPWYKKIPGANKVAQLAGSVKSAAIDPVIKIIKGAAAAVGGPRGILKGMGKVLRGVPLVGPVIELFFGKGDIEKLKEQRANNQITTDEELYRLAGQRVIKGIGGLLGGASGALALSWIPGIGTLAGGLIGDILGRIGAETVANYLLPKETTMDIGRLVVKSPIKDEELQDFLVKGDRVYKFNNKDEVLGMKEGGAVNSLISSITNTNEKQFSISTRQVKILEEIRDGIKEALTLRSSSNTNNYNGGRESQSRPSLTPFNLRSEFDSMNNIATI